MPGLIVHQSNRVENLVGVLAREVASCDRDPLTPLTIVVQSRGMERWLCIELARQSGVLANTRFPFPNTILQELFTAVLGDARPNSLFDGDPLTFRTMATLPSCLGEENFAPLRDYIGTSAEDLRLFQLCQKIAGMYDQLSTFRPELIRAWNRGEGDSWHGSLWQRMFDDEEKGAHRPELFQLFMERMQKWQGPLAGISQKLFIFGISTLPRLHLQALAAVSAHVEVQLFLLNPCQAFWHDVASDKSQLKMTRKVKAAPGQGSSDLHFERGHPLLSSQGTLAQEFLNLVTEYADEFKDHFQSSEREDLLHTLQNQILELTDPASEEKRLLEPADRSIQIHSCHAPMREVETLRDQLLRCMEEDAGLEPRDILVLAPDIESYAPYITAVFDGESLEQQKIPFSIADRSRQKESPASEAFLKLLTLRGGRMTASQLLELLEEPAVLQRSGLTLDDLDLVRHWISETRICWGVDGATKEAFGLPALANNTWQAGFDRIFLGFALPANEHALFKGLLPYDAIEGGAALIFGKFHHFCQKLFTTLETLATKRSLSGWRTLLSALVEDFFLLETGDEAFTLLRQLQKLAETEKISGYADDIDFEVIYALLEKELLRASTSGFLRGRVTFCSLLPMRSIPFKVIALLGMNDAAFPRKSTAAGFDPMASAPQKGDPSRRQEDRYLFLEAILSARDTLIISYIGQSVRDNSEAPPSVVVSELLDALEQGFICSESCPLRERLVTRHRLQGFNPVYFSQDQRLFSYSRENYLGAAALAKSQPGGADKVATSRFMSKELPAAEEATTIITLTQLVKFLQNPAQFFLRNRLGIYLDEASSAVQDQEPFILDGLANYQISQQLVERFLTGAEAAPLYDLYAAKGILPQGSLSAPTFDKCVSAAHSFARKVAAFTAGNQPATLPYDQTFDGVRLVGQLTGLYPQGLLRHRCASIKAKDRLATWVHHLAFCSLAEQGREETVRSYLLGNGSNDQSYNFIAESQELLKELLQLFLAGQLQPLAFFPKSSFSFAEASRKGEVDEKCLGRAKESWLGNERSAGESQEADFDFCFGRLDPFDCDFIALARKIIDPLLSNQAGA